MTRAVVVKVEDVWSIKSINVGPTMPMLKPSWTQQDMRQTVLMYRTLCSEMSLRTRRLMDLTNSKKGIFGERGESGGRKGWKSDFRGWKFQSSARGWFVSPCRREPGDTEYILPNKVRWQLFLHEWVYEGPIKALMCCSNLHEEQLISCKWKNTCVTR